MEFWSLYDEELLWLILLNATHLVEKNRDLFKQKSIQITVATPAPFFSILNFDPHTQSEQSKKSYAECSLQIEIIEKCL